MDPLQGFQFRNRREHEGAIKPDLEAQRMVKESEIENLRSSLRGNRSGKSDKKAISDEERGQISQKIGKPRAELQKIEKELAGPLFIASDCTPEGMARLLTLHGETLFHTDSDAGDALAAILGRYKQDSESSQTESLWLKSYSGESIVIGRMKEGLLIIEEPAWPRSFYERPKECESFSRRLDSVKQGSFRGFMSRTRTPVHGKFLKRSQMRCENFPRTFPSPTKQPCGRFSGHIAWRQTKKIINTSST